MGDAYWSKGTWFGSDHSANNIKGGSKTARNIAQNGPRGQFFGDHYWHNTAGSVWSDWIDLCWGSSPSLLNNDTDMILTLFLYPYFQLLQILFLFYHKNLCIVTTQETVCIFNNSYCSYRTSVSKDNGMQLKDTGIIRLAKRLLLNGFISIVDLQTTIAKGSLFWPAQSNRWMKLPVKLQALHEALSVPAA